MIKLTALMILQLIENNLVNIWKHMPKKVNIEPAESSELGPEYYEVESVIDKRITPKGQEEYLIKWKHYPHPRDYTWEPIQHLLQVKDLVQQFNKHFQKKKKKQDNIQHHKKKEEEHEDQQVILVSPEPEPELQPIEEELKAAEHQPKKRGRKKKEVKEVEEQKRFLPKVINTDTLLPKKREKIAKRIESDDEVQPTLKRKVKDEGGRAVATVPLNSDESSPLVQEQWYTRPPYRLGPIYKHIFEGCVVSYVVNVQNLDGELVTMVCLSEGEMQKVDKEKVKGYLLSYFYGLVQSTNDNQLQDFWAE